MRSVEEVFFSKVSGEFFLEIFEKSIDKHKIDAILNAPSDRNGSLEGAVLEVGVTRSRRIPRKNPAYPSRYRERFYSPGLLCADVHGRERRRGMRAGFGGVL